MELTQTTIPDYPRGITFEQVLAAMMEDREEQRERHKEIDRMQKENACEMEKLRESQRETDRMQKETAQQMKETDRRIGSLTNLFGDVTEAMMAPKLCDKFRELGLNFPRANPNVFVNDRKNQIFLEIDIMLENGDKAMVVEVKTKLTTERIDKHIERMGKMRVYADLHGDKRTFLGAVAGIVVTDEVREYALDQGFYFIEPAGDNFNITPPNGEAKEW